MTSTLSVPADDAPARVVAGAWSVFAPSADDVETHPAMLWLQRFTPVLQASVILSIWLLNRLYRGIVHDSRIYVGRALADLDPHGLGREPTFLYDSQTNHTVFSRLLSPLVSAFGPSATSIGVTLTALLIWLAAAAWLAGRLMPRRMVPAALACAAVLPAFYGAFDVFSFGEALATPRGFAEAGVLAALAALMNGRRLLCGALLLLAAVFHPVMAAPGFGVMFLSLAHEDRRWWGLAPLGLGVALIAGGLNLGPAKALFATYDPEWLRIMHVRNGFLFLKDWPPAAWCEAALPITTLSLAARIVSGRHRVIVAAALLVVVGSLAASFVFGDLLGSQLIIQLQLWRALWIVQVLAVLILPVVAVDLWMTGRCDARLCLVLMGLSWLELGGTLWDLPVLAAAVGCAATALRGRADPVSRRVLITVSLGALAIMLAEIGVSAFFAFKVTELFAGAGIAPPVNFLLALKPHLPRYLVVAVALTPLLFPNQFKPSVYAIGLALSALVLAPLCILNWDQRTPARRMIDLGQGRTELGHLIGPPDGTGVVWVPDDSAPWFLLSRATWASDLQGSVGTFSRPLSIGWDTRAAEVVASGLGTIRNRNPWDQGPARRVLNNWEWRDGALRLCAVKQGPQAVVLSGDLTHLFLPGVAALWRAPVTNMMLAPGSSTLKIIPFSTYTVVRCERLSSSGGRRMRNLPPTFRPGVP